MGTESAKPFVLSDADFFTTIKSESLLVTDFWASWCPPCKSMESVIEELAEKFASKIRFAKVDVDANPITAQHFGIMSIPTFLITNRGKVLDVVIGAVPKNEFEEIISKYLEN